MSPWLWLPSKLAHDISPHILPLISTFTPTFDNRWSPLKWRNLHFANPLGLAGGVDKNGSTLACWKKLGAGFLEVGTVTPKPQGPNPGQILLRDKKHKALWNKMGFPNVGGDQLAQTLKKLKKGGTPLFVNIGKNRWTKPREAFLDYVLCIKKLQDYADSFVVNLSSPNTQGLRDLLETAELKTFLSSLHNHLNHSNLLKKPLLLKLSPDMNEDSLKRTLEVSTDFVDGWILTNSTKSRYPSSPFPSKEGGVSGRPLAHLSRKALAIATSYKNQNPKKLIISTGGINGHGEILKRLEMGADLIQVYSALVFSGPLFFRNQIKELKKRHNTFHS